MAKRIINWTLENVDLCLNKYNSDKDAKTETLKTFAIPELYPEFENYSDVQKQILVYGIKQKLADAGASAIGDVSEKVMLAEKMWTNFLDGKFTGERTNATGNAENKRILANVKTASKVVSLEGLMMKKLSFPDTFTEADQTKLDEFMKIAVNAKTKKK